MNSKQFYQTKMEFLAKEWQVRVNELAEKAVRLDEADQQRFLGAIEQLAQKNEYFKEELGKFKTSRIEPWGDMKISLDQIARDVDESFRQALCYFK